MRLHRLVLVLLMAIAAGAAGVEARQGGSNDIGFSVNFGLAPNGVAGAPAIGWPGRWMPITFTLTCGPAPFEGVVEIEYPTEGKQTVRMQRPIVGTPNKTVSSLALVNLGIGTD